LILLTWGFVATAMDLGPGKAAWPFASGLIRFRPIRPSGNRRALTTSRKAASFLLRPPMCRECLLTSGFAGKVLPPAAVGSGGYGTENQRLILIDRMTAETPAMSPDMLKASQARAAKAQ